MAFIGNTVTTQGFTPAVDFFSGNASTTAFTLSKPVASVAQVQAVIENVPQNPGSAYTVSGNTITFTSAPPSGTNNIYVYYTSPITQVIQPSQGTVGATQLVGGTVNTTADVVANGLTVGKGGGSVSTNTVVGYQAGQSNTTNPQNTFVGYTAGYSSTGGYTSAFGYQAGYAITTGTSNTALGRNSMSSGAGVTGSNNTGVGESALLNLTSGASNVSVGVESLRANTTASNNTAVGYQAGYYQTGAYNTVLGAQALYGASGTSTGGASCAIGYKALYANTSGNYNIAIGNEYTGNWPAPLAANTTGSTNIAIGTGALSLNTTSSGNLAIGYVAANSTTGAQNTAIGTFAMYGGTTGYGNCAFGYQTLYSLLSGYFNTNIGYQAGSGITSGANNLCLGQGAGNTASPSGNLTTQSNRICLGDNSISNAYIQVAWTVTSDARDKADIVDSRYGLNFVSALRPVEYKWDMRSKYEEGQTPDGTHKETKTNLGFLAQDVIEAEKAHGGVEKDLLIADDELDELLRITETKMIPALVKAIQELKALVDAQATEIAELKAKVG